MSERSVGEGLRMVADDLERLGGEAGRLLTEGGGGSSQWSPLVRLLQRKEAELKAELGRLPAHRERQATIVALQAKLKARNESIGGLESLLKEAETALLTDIFQANQKLRSIAEAKERRVRPTELIRFAHRISKDNGVAAPASWEQGDPARPFPTDVQMRRGWLMPRRPEAPTVPPPQPPQPHQPPPPPHRMPMHPHPFPRQGSPVTPRHSPYQGGPVPGHSRMPASPLGGPPPRGLPPHPPPPYPGSPRGWSPAAVPRGPPTFPHHQSQGASPGLSPRPLRGTAHPGFPQHYPAPPPPPNHPLFPVGQPRLPVQTPNPYQAGPVGQPPRPRPQPPPLPPQPRPPVAAPPKPESSPDSSSSDSSSNSPNNN